MSAQSEQSHTDVRFLEAFVESIPKPAYEMAWAELRPVSESFFANYERASTSGYVVISIALGSVTIIQARHYAAKRLGLDDRPLEDKDIPEFDRETTEVLRHMTDQLTREAGEAGRDAIYGLFESFTALQPQLQEGLEVLLGSMLVNAWTAFEAAASDLWEEALNAAPNRFAIKAIDTYPPTKEEDGTVRQSTKKDQPDGEVGRFIKRLIIIGEPIRAGSLLKVTQKFKQDSLRGLGWSYECAFPEEAANTFAQKPFEYLEVLEGLRNVLVHRGGKADKRFLKRVLDSPERYAELGLDRYAESERVRIDGPLVRTLMDAVFQATTLLFEMVDRSYASKPK